MSPVCTGDKPELLYPEAAAELSAMGYGSTLEYVAAAAEAVLQQTGLIPHINAGVMDQQQLLRWVNRGNNACGVTPSHLPCVDRVMVEGCVQGVWAGALTDPLGIERD